MARITFVYPDYESLGVEYLMAACLKEGHEVNFIFYFAEDIFFTKKNKNDYQNIAKQIVATKPHIVAYSCVTDNYLYQRNCANAVKSLMPDVVNIFGGVHVSAVPKYVIKRPEVDCIAIGESEVSFIDFLNNCTFNNTCILPDVAVNGIVFKKGDKIIGEYIEGELPDLDFLPFAHKQPFYTNQIALTYKYSIMTSRGCPNKCTYCFNSAYYIMRGNSKIRQRSVENVISELMLVKQKFSPKYIHFLDDCFTTNKRWLLEFCERYKELIRLPFCCSAIPRYIDIEKAEALSKAGCYDIHIGIQSIDKRMCEDVLHRKSNNEQISSTISILKNVGILVQVDHMLGIPGDTVQIQQESVLFYNKCRPDNIIVFWLAYYPNTLIIDIAKQHGILDEGDIENINEGIKLTEKSIIFGGSLKDPAPFKTLATIITCLPFLPTWLVFSLIKLKLYKIVTINNPYITLYLPMFLFTISNRNYYQGWIQLFLLIRKKVPFLGKILLKYL